MEGVTGWRNSRCRGQLTGWAATLSPERAGLRQGKPGAGFSPHRSVRGSPPQTSLPRRQPAEKTSLRASEGCGPLMPRMPGRLQDQKLQCTGWVRKTVASPTQPWAPGSLDVLQVSSLFELLSLHPTSQTNGEEGHHFLQWRQHLCPRFPLRCPQQTALIGPGISFQDSNPG